MPHDSGFAGIVELYDAAVPHEFFEQIERELELSARRRVFNLPLIVWLMIAQRLEASATMSTVVQQVAQQRPQALLTDHKRNREGTVSCHTGAYSDARQAMPLQVAERVADRVLDHLLVSRREALPGFGRRVFVLDGTSVEAPHTSQLRQGRAARPVVNSSATNTRSTGQCDSPC